MKRRESGVFDKDRKIVHTTPIYYSLRCMFELKVTFLCLFSLAEISFLSRFHIKVINRSEGWGHLFPSFALVTWITHLSPFWRTGKTAKWKKREKKLCCSTHTLLWNVVTRFTDSQLDSPSLPFFLSLLHDWCPPSKSRGWRDFSTPSGFVLWEQETSLLRTSTAGCDENQIYRQRKEERRKEGRKKQVKGWQTSVAVGRKQESERNDHIAVCVWAVRHFCELGELGGIRTMCEGIIISTFFSFL